MKYYLCLSDGQVVQGTNLDSLNLWLKLPNPVGRLNKEELFIKNGIRYELFIGESLNEAKPFSGDK